MNCNVTLAVEGDVPVSDVLSLLGDMAPAMTFNLPASLVYSQPLQTPTAIVREWGEEVGAMSLFDTVAIPVQPRATLHSANGDEFVVAANLSYNQYLSGPQKLSSPATDAIFGTQSPAYVEPFAVPSSHSDRPNILQCWESPANGTSIQRTSGLASNLPDSDACVKIWEARKPVRSPRFITALV